MSQKANQATHFYISPDAIDNDTCHFSLEESDHILKSFRLGIGDSLKATDGCGNLYDIRISACRDRHIYGKIVNTSYNVNELPVKITIGFGLLSMSKTGQLIDQCTQLGVSGFTPLVSCKSISKPDKEKINNKLTRWRKIAIAAMKQSLRSTLPEITAPTDIAGLLEQIPEFDLVLLASFQGGEFPAERKKPGVDKVLLLSGPEGGYSDAEETELLRVGVIPVNLGQRRLRAELAPVVFTSAFLARMNFT